jgi:hypothetical protein
VLEMKKEKKKTFLFFSKMAQNEAEGNRVFALSKEREKMMEEFRLQKERIKQVLC